MVILLGGLFMGIAAAMLAVGLWVYRHNYILVTDRHLIQVEQHGLFSRQVDQVSLGRLQDVSGVKSGFLATLWNFGTVTIQSAGEQRQFVFTRVPAPQELADYCLAVHEEYSRNHPGEGEH
jgi:hypothetical protein